MGATISSPKVVPNAPKQAPVSWPPANATSPAMKQHQGSTLSDEPSSHGSVAMQPPPTTMDELLDRNRQWALDRVTEDPAYFRRLQNLQTPRWLWIGCADSRVPANVIVGLQPGEVFVQRNVGNQATHTDMNVMACLEYAVKELRVKTIICCGHYGCGAVKAALQMPSKTQGIVNCWISDIRECRNQHDEELRALPPTQRVDRLCELNVIRQCFHVCTAPVVQNAWDQGQELSVFGVVYSLRDGLVHKLVGPLTKDSVAMDLAEYEQSRFSSKNGSMKGGWAPVKHSTGGGRFSLGCDHGFGCACQGGPMQEPANAAHRTATLASMVAAHSAWSKPVAQ